MTWFKVDDSLAFHHKVVGVGNAAMGLWVRAGAWSAQQLKDGLVPGAMLKALGGTTQQAKALVAHGLWEDREDGTYLFHDWHLYQPTSTEVKAERLARSEAKSRAGKAGGIASGVSRRTNKEAEPKQTPKQEGSTCEANANENEAPSRPVPSRPSSASSADADRAPSFEEFWLLYPRKVGRGDAQKAWLKAIKKTEPRLIMSGAWRLANTPGLDIQFTPHPSTWLNGERWLDVDRSPTSGNPATAWAREQG